MSPSLTTFLFELVNFLILAGALGWFLFTPIRNALEARKAAEEKQLREAQAKIAEAERASAESEKERRQLELDRDRIIREAETAAAKQADALLAEARNAAAKERSEAGRELTAISEAQLERLASASAGAAATVMEKLFVLLQAPELQRQLVDAARREASSMADRLSGNVIVESATEIDEDAAAGLKAALGKSVTVEYRTRPEIGAGIRIQTNQGMIDLTAAGLAVYAKRELENRLLTEARESADSSGEVRIP